MRQNSIKRRVLPNGHHFFTGFAQITRQCFDKAVKMVNDDNHPAGSDKTASDAGAAKRSISSPKASARPRALFSVS